MIRFKEDVPYENVAIRFPIANKERSAAVLFGPEVEEPDMSNSRIQFQKYGINKTDKFTGLSIKMGLVEK